MLKPIEFETTIDLSTINSSEGSIKSGGYVTKTQNKFIWYSGRTISNSVYLEAWTTPIVFDGSNGDTYDISELIYSWVGSSTNKDRVSSITCNVLQYDPRINNSEGRTYNTGWPEHYYSGSFSKTSSTLDLKAGCVIESMGCTSTGIEINATFDDGNETRSAILSEGWGTIQW
ncbi:MAG: hypothetical protein SCJ93_11995 [Bacillota bacterium]|nr:hypothetical protein [Bacillota bacterium]